jgi:nucleotide-binding universal stress UspA family protein
LVTTRKVLIPLDGSAWSRQVLPRVIPLLNPAEYQIVLFQAGDEPEVVGIEPVVPQLVSSTFLPAYRVEQEARARRQMVYASQVWERTQSALEAELENDAQALRDAGFNVSVTVRFGDPAEEIVEYARYPGVDMIVMATHGRTGLMRFVLGSVAEQVIRNVHIPVMLIRPNDRAEAEALEASA